MALIHGLASYRRVHTRRREAPIHRACVTIIRARLRKHRPPVEYTAGIRITRVCRALVIVIAGSQRPGHTDTGRIAHINICTGITVIAWLPSTHMVAAPFRRIAGIGRTLVAVVTGEGGRGYARPKHAGLNAVADVVIAARSAVRYPRMPAPHHRIADVGRTHVVIVTHLYLANRGAPVAVAALRRLQDFGVACLRKFHRAVTAERTGIEAAARIR